MSKGVRSVGSNILNEHEEVVDTARAESKRVELVGLVRLS